ncbi:3-hydroxyacyl-ACP dehydratase [Flavobacterium sp.]|uniref:3-hydroxyacyl-ACP dehydratase n=1 Tax=Flavobacterium sp. TaxID=239 RepID=UPI0037509CE8
MLLNNFYKVISIENTAENNYLAMILINEKHEVFKGHFPDNPIMPGVCMMQIIKELTEQISASSLFMQSLTNVKFMALINPFNTPELRLELDISMTENDLVKVKNVTYFNDTVALKLSSVYRKV